MSRGRFALDPEQAVDAEAVIDLVAIFDNGFTGG